MSRSALARHRFAQSYLRTSAEGGGGGGGSSEGQGGGGSTDDKGQGGGSGGGSTAPEEARDEHGAGLGFPKDTRTEDMTDQQKANYWRNQSKVQQKLREQRERELEEERQKSKGQSGQQGQGSGTVPDQQQGSGNTQADSAAIRSEAAQDAALATIRTSLALRGKSADDIDSLVDVLSMAKFVTADHKVDTAKVVAFVDKNAPASGSNGGGGSDFGAGRREGQRSDRKSAAREEAERRFAGKENQPNRGSLGGLRR